MEQQYESDYHIQEDKHWWFKSRRNILMQLLSRLDKSIKILDVGCSSGIFLGELLKMGYSVEQLYGIDISEEGISKARARGLKHVFVMDGAKINLPKESFDLIIASDSLEHIESEQEALANWASLLKSQGQLIIFVPAFMFLWSAHDVVNQHFRRYTRKELVQKVQQFSFQIERSGYWNFGLFFPIASIRFIKNKFSKEENNAKGDLAYPGNLINGILSLILMIENTLFPWIRFPVGVSTFCIARKK